MLVCLVLLSGCVTLPDPEESQEYRADTVARTGPHNPAGQSFVSRRAGLNGIQLWLTPGSQAGANLTFELYRGSQASGTPVFTQAVPFQQLQNANPFNLGLPPQPDPPGQVYTLRLVAAGGEVRVAGRNEDVYPRGNAWIAGEPLAADFAFRLTYDYNLVSALDDLGAFVGRGWLLLPLALCLWLPGRLLLALAGPQPGLDPGERWALSTGLSLAAIPVWMTWTSLAGLHWTRTAVWIGAAALALSLAALAWRRRPRPAEPEISAGPPPDRPDKARPAFWILSILFLLSLGVRLAMVRDLAGPPWVDSVHHALLTRLIVENGAFPASYAPYLDLETASYHAGFHSQLAVFHWLSGMELDQAMLLFGQVLNALAVVQVYLLTTTLTGSRMAGVISAAVVGLFTPMPAYYTSWGRYTQLAGLLILPAAARLLAEAIPGLFLPAPTGAAPPRATRLRSAALAGLACAGLFLTHYRVAAFLGVLLLAALLTGAVSGQLARRSPRATPAAAGWLAGVAALAVLLTLPWWPETLASLFVPSLSWSQGPRVAFFHDFSWTYLTTASGRYALALAGLGLAWSILQRQRFPWTLVLWVAGLFFLANLGALGLPGAGFVNHTSVEISLFLPQGVLAGYLLAWGVAAWGAVLPDRWRPAYRAGLVLASAGLLWLGARSLLPVLNPVTFLTRQADRAALSWAAEHLPPGETVLINPFSWGYSVYAGADGGYWLPASAGHPTLPPPVLYGLDSAGSPRAAEIAAGVRQALEAASDPPALAELMRARGISTIFLGAKGGAFSPALLARSPLFDQVYHANGVSIFRLRP